MPVNGSENDVDRLQRAMKSAARVADKELEGIYGSRVGFVLVAGPVSQDDNTPTSYVTNIRQDLARGVLIGIGKQIEKGGVQEPFVANDP